MSVRFTVENQVARVTIDRPASLNAVDLPTEAELVRILTEPKNALLKQYAKLLGMDGVDLSINKEGLLAMAREAVKRGTGARGLRSIFERIMLDVMYDVPSRMDVRSVSINEAVVKGERPPILRKRIERNAA